MDAFSFSRGPASVEGAPASQLPHIGKLTQESRLRVQWRVCFRFIDGDAYDVEICDYH